MSKLRSMEELFASRHFDHEVILLCVRWYLRYKLSFRDLVEMMAERGLRLAANGMWRQQRRSLGRRSGTRANRHTRSLWTDMPPRIERYAKLRTEVLLGKWTKLRSGYVYRSGRTLRYGIGEGTRQWQQPEFPR